jgi:hypothetical protein
LAEVVFTTEGQEFISLILTGEIFNIKSKALTDPDLAIDFEIFPEI